MGRAPVEPNKLDNPVHLKKGRNPRRPGRRRLDRRAPGRASVPRSTLYLWRKRDEEFAA
jgi:hypothetical protein